MVRIQLHLTEAQDRRLRALARKRGLTRAELIRRGVELVLEDPSGAGEPLLDLIGAAGEGKRADVAERHDEVLYRIPRERSRSRAAEKDREP